MRINEDNTVCNVAAQKDDPNSVFSYWKNALQLRKCNAVLASCIFQLWVLLWLILLLGLWDIRAKVDCASGHDRLRADTGRGEMALRR